MLDKETIAITEELSPTSTIEEVESKQKKLADLQRDMKAQEEKLARLTEIAQQLSDLGQTEAAEKIVSQIETLTQRWVALRQVSAEKSGYLLRSHEVQRYNRDCEGSFPCFTFYFFISVRLQLSDRRCVRKLIFLEIRNFLESLTFE